jgi:hypothetical protein
MFIDGRGKEFLATCCQSEESSNGERQTFTAPFYRQAAPKEPYPNSCDSTYHYLEGISLAAQEDV